MFLTPLAQLNDFCAGRWGFHFERVGRQFDLGAVGAKHGDRTGVALLARDSELEVVHPSQTLAALGVAGEGELAQGDVAIEQFKVQTRAVLLDPLQRTLA